jgi:hypothetical protein
VNVSNLQSVYKSGRHMLTGCVHTLGVWQVVRLRSSPSWQCWMEHHASIPVSYCYIPFSFSVSESLLFESHKVVLIPTYVTISKESGKLHKCLVNYDGQ